MPSPSGAASVPPWEPPLLPTAQSPAPDSQAKGTLKVRGPTGRQQWLGVTNR